MYRPAGSPTIRCSCQPNNLRPMAEPIRLVLVEDNQVFREALELLLGLQSDIEVVATTGPPLPKSFGSTSPTWC